MTQNVIIRGRDEDGVEKSITLTVIEVGDGEYRALHTLQVDEDGNILGGEDHPIKTELIYDGDPVEPLTSIGITPPTTLVAAVKTVTTAGTGERITATSTPCQYVIISALPDNTGTVFVGGSDVDKDTMNGIPLTNPADSDGIKVPSSIIIPIDDLNKLYVDVTASGEGISYTVLT